MLSEEAGRLEIMTGGPPSSMLYVVVDPLDGSIAYRRRIPLLWLIAIGLLDHRGVPSAASVYEIQTGRAWWADASGAWTGTLGSDARPRETRPLRPSRQMELDGAVLVAGLSKPRYLFPTIDRFRTVLRRAGYVLSNAGPMGPVMVGSGMADAYVSLDLPLTEVYSSLGIAMAAGAIISDMDGKPLEFVPDIEARYSFVCSANPAIHQSILESLAGGR